MKFESFECQFQSTGISRKIGNIYLRIINSNSGVCRISVVPNFGGHVCRGNMSKYLSPSPEYFILSSCRRSLTTHVAQKTCEYCTNSVCPQKGASIINRFTSTATSMPTFAFKYSPRAKKIQKSKNLERSYILVINFCFLFFFFGLSSVKIYIPEVGVLIY